MGQCIKCGTSFDLDHPARILCNACCYLPEDDICFEHLHLGEGMLECDIAKKGHPLPHFWRGEIDGKQVRVEWS